MVAERAYYNGGSNRNKLLDDLVFQLWNLQMRGNLRLHVYHVAGTRMIESGIDGLSRGDLTEGVSKGSSIMQFVPIHESPIARSPKVFDWVMSWWEPKWGELHLMSKEDWFDKVMSQGCFLWDVPPVAGEVAVEQLCTHVHGRPESLHIVLIPRLCTSLWRKQLGKCVDLVLPILAGQEFWSSAMHEPLILAIYLPLLPPLHRYQPWRLRNSRLVAGTQLALHGMQKAGHKVDWNRLRQLLLKAWQIPRMHGSLARNMLQT